MNPFDLGDKVRLIERPSKMGEVVEILNSKIVGVRFPGLGEPAYCTIEILELVIEEPC